ncbi:hypothetical protein MYCTH_2030078, partial [Thermothelomyces thermophilus ATCC 42464]
AAIAIAAPTLPLKICLTHLPNPAPKGSPHPALARSQHTLTVIRNKAFIFGGQDASGALCPPGIHTITLPAAPTQEEGEEGGEPDAGAAYTCYPPYTLQDASTGETLVPQPRAGHAACARGGRYLLVQGGRGADGRPVEEGNCIWQWDCEGLSWAKLRGPSQLGVEMAPGRWGHWMFADEDQGFLVMVGGKTRDDGGGDGGGSEREAWMYDLHAAAWTTLPRLTARPLAAAYAAGKIYIISSGEGDIAPGDAKLGGMVHFLDMRESPTEREKPGALAWQSVRFPANPLAPGPQPRAGGALVPLRTGHGRVYLVYLFGCSDEGGRKGEKEYYSDIWTLQLPAQTRSAAAVKDKIREKLPRFESGEFRWAEAEIVPTEQIAAGGKVHPGPRGLFAADACLDGHGVMLWGGINAKGEAEGDGWVLRLAHGYADSDRYE